MQRKRTTNKNVVSFKEKQLAKERALQEEYAQKKKLEQKKGIKKHKSSRSRSNLPAPDVWLITFILGVLIFGLIMVYSSSYYQSNILYGLPYKLVAKQAFFAVIGFIGMLCIGYFVNYRIFLDIRVASLIYAASLGLSISLFFIGTELNGATRWIDLGFITIQPSEFVKIGVILMVASYIVNFRKNVEKGTFKEKITYVLIGMALIVFPALLVASENLSSGIVIGVIGFIMLFVSTPRIWYYFALVGIVALISVSVYSIAMNTDRTVEIGGLTGKILKQYRLDRIRMWKDPWIDPLKDGYQTIQSLYAVGSGGLTGSGLGQGIQKLGYLPEPYNDIIFAVICEELGLIGAGGLLLAYGVIVLRGFYIALNTDDLFGTLVGIGVSSMVGIQAIFNAAVNTNSIPTTGMQLPLVSFGGTALVLLLGALGILLNISRYSNIRRIEV